MAAGDTPITISGNLVDDPELRFTPSGQPVARFRVASTPRFRDNASGEWKDGDSLFLSCNVSGRLRQRSYETKEGEKRTVYEVEVDDVGPSLRNASAKVAKVSRSGGGFGGGQGGQGGQSYGGNGGGNGSGGSSGSGGGGGRAEADPWASSDSGGFSDEPPF